MFISVLDQYKERMVPIARRLLDLGFTLCATEGTAAALNAAGVSACRVLKIHEGRPNVVDMLKDREIQLITNTPIGRRGKSDSTAIRREALARHIPTITTIPGAAAAVTGLESLARGELKVLSLQEYHAGKTLQAQGRLIAPPRPNLDFGLRQLENPRGHSAVPATGGHAAGSLDTGDTASVPGQ